jgi:D-sedoheptulose 7-phosphate isomerase
VEYANALGATTLAIVGFDGGKLKKLAKHVLHVEVHDMQIVEDLHLAFGHMFMKRLCAIKGD